MHKVSLHKLEPLVSELIFVDAHSGKIVFRLDEVARSNPQSVNRSVYDCSKNFYSSGVGCVVNSPSLVLDYTFGCTEGNCPRGANPLSAPYGDTTDVDDLYYLLGHVHDYTWNTFGRTGGNGRGGIGDNQGHGIGHVPFDETIGWVYLNAIGQDCRQVASWANYCVTFCLGAVVSDIVGHEYGHSLSHFHSFNPDDTFNSITYYGESGSLIENYADAYGEGLERYLHGTNDWLMGSGLVAGPFRDWANPPSITYAHPDLGDTPSPTGSTTPTSTAGTGTTTACTSRPTS